MADGIQISTGFDVKAPVPIDLRTSFPTLAVMKAFDETRLYDGIKAYCAEDRKTYEWNSHNTVDQTTGKWREFGGGGGIEIPAVTKAELQQMIDNGTIVMERFYYCSTEKCLYRGTVKIGGEAVKYFASEAAWQEWRDSPSYDPNQIVSYPDPAEPWNVRNTYDPTSEDPISGKGVAQAVGFGSVVAIPDKTVPNTPTKVDIYTPQKDGFITAVIESSAAATVWMFPEDISYRVATGCNQSNWRETLQMPVKAGKKVQMNQNSTSTVTVSNITFFPIGKN